MSTTLTPTATADAKVITDARADSGFQALFGTRRGAHHQTTPLNVTASAGVLICDSESALAHIAAAKIPVSELWPRRAHYVASLHDGSLCPTEAELTLLRGYIECVVTNFYREGLAARMLAAPYAGDDGHCTQTFTKRGPNDWAHRSYTWEHGPWPFLNSDIGPLSLLALLDHMEKRENELSTRWQAWRDAHPALVAQFGNTL